MARQSAKQKNIIIVIKKSICKVSQNCPASASINQTLLFCCVVFYLVFFCFASFLIIVSDCISTCPLAFFSIVIIIIKFNNKLVTINFESSKYKKDFHLSPPNILLVSHVNRNFEHALNCAIKGITHVSALLRGLRLVFLGDKIAIFGYQIGRSSSDYIYSWSESTGSQTFLSKAIGELAKFRIPTAIVSCQVLRCAVVNL